MVLTFRFVVPVGGLDHFISRGHSRRMVLAFGFLVLSLRHGLDLFAWAHCEFINLSVAILAQALRQVTVLGFAVTTAHHGSTSYAGPAL